MIKSLCSAIMRKSLLTKTILIIIFFTNIGFFSGTYNIFSEMNERDNENNPEFYLGKDSNERFFEIREFIHQKYLTAVKNEKYNPDLYFQDLISINTKINELKTAYASGMIIRLQNISRKHYDSSNEYYKDVEIAKSNYLEKLYEVKGETLHSNVKIDFNAILTWFLITYFTSMPLALLYFLIISNEEKEWEKFSIRSPISFILAIIFYPFVCLTLLMMGLKEVVTETQYRRMKNNVFSSLSKDEMAYIKSVARKIPIWKLNEYFTNNHQEFKSEFAIAIIAVILIGIIPKDTFASTAICNYDPPLLTISDHLARIHIDDTEKDNNDPISFYALPTYKFKLIKKEIYCIINFHVNTLINTDSKKQRKIPISAY